jgi:thioredoxin-related protein
MSEHIAWRKSLEEARQEAAQNGKLVLIELFSPKCAGCQNMDEKTFPDARVRQTIAEDFVPVHFNVLENEDVMKEYVAGWTPTIIVQDGAGREHYRTQGYLNPNSFVAELLAARVQEALHRQDFQTAHTLAQQAVAATKNDDERQAQALYWEAVAAYKSSDDQDKLINGWKQLFEKLPDADWSKRVEFVKEW